MILPTASLPARPSGVPGFIISTALKKAKKGSRMQGFEAEEEALDPLPP
jgi:hypothetical protein